MVFMVFSHAQGECNRGEECPYRHEMPTDPSDPLANQNLKDRWVWQLGVANTQLIFSIPC